MTTYKKFLELARVISEEDFNALQQELPNIEYDITSLDIPYNLDNKTDIAGMFIRAMLEN